MRSELWNARNSLVFLGETEMMVVADEPSGKTTGWATIDQRREPSAGERQKEIEAPASPEASQIVGDRVYESFRTLAAWGPF